MPFSIKLFNSLSGLKNDLSIYNEKKAKFIGSLYEPRTKKLMYIKKELNKLNLDLEIMGRVVGKERRSDSIYWETLVNSSIILTTSDQIESDEIDWNWVPNLVYRYLEAIASGSLLIAPDVPSISRFFKPFIHFIPFTSEKDAVDKIVYYLANENERENIANAGKKKAEFLIKSHLFWASIDTALSSENLV
jgi:glycosyltransferase involved in cell wall biosynthesis